MIDEFTKESLFIDVAGPIRGKRVVEMSELVAAEHAAAGVGRYTWQRDMLIGSGNPWQNGTNEDSNGQFFGDECLAMNWIHSRKPAKALIEQ
jgi:putative transposase